MGQQAPLNRGEGGGGRNGAHQAAVCVGRPDGRPGMEWVPKGGRGWGFSMWSCAILQEENVVKVKNVSTALLMQAFVSVVHHTQVSSLACEIFTKDSCP